MPARRAIEALAREIAAEEPESFEDRRGVLERLQILVRLRFADPRGRDRRPIHFTALPSALEAAPTLYWR